MIYTLIIANLGMLLITAFAFQTLPPVVPLFYSKPEGDSQLAYWWLLIIIPLSLNALYVLNNTVTKRLFSQSDFANKIIWYANLSLIVIFTVIFIKIVTLVS